MAPRANQPKTQKPSPRFYQQGRRLLLARRALGFGERGGQTRFAAGAGLKQNAYNQFEKGTRQITRDAAMALYDAYGITLAWIAKGDRNGLSLAILSNLPSPAEISLQETE